VFFYEAAPCLTRGGGHLTGMCFGSPCESLQIRLCTSRPELLDCEVQKYQARLQPRSPQRINHGFLRRWPIGELDAVRQRHEHPEHKPARGWSRRGEPREVQPELIRWPRHDGEQPQPAAAQPPGSLRESPLLQVTCERNKICSPRFSFPFFERRKQRRAALGARATTRRRDAVLLLTPVDWCSHLCWVRYRTRVFWNMTQQARHPEGDVRPCALHTALGTIMNCVRRNKCIPRQTGTNPAAAAFQFFSVFCEDKSVR